jgi:hypothetical protein
MLGAVMARVEWVVAEEWCDLIDHDKKWWQVTYRQARTNYAVWEVMYPGTRNTEYIPIKDMPEHQLRDRLRMEYLLLRGADD